MQRRSMMKLVGSGVGAALGAPAIFSRAQAATVAAFDPKNADHIALAHRKLAYSADGSTTFSWIRAMRYALIDSAYTPMWELHSGTIFRTVDKPDGNYEVHAINAIYYTELETEKYIETIKNPFTGQTVTFPYALPSAAKPKVRVTLFEKTGPKEEFVTAPGYKLLSRGNRLGPAWVVGDQVWIRGDSSARLEPTEPGKRLSQVNDWTTHTGSVKHVMDASIKNPPSTHAFNDTNTFPAWFGMEDRPGNYVSRGYGQKAFKYDDMPKVWRDLFTAKNPDIAKDPKAALGA